MTERFELLDEDTGTYHGCVYQEGGWFSRASPTRAKGFFKQDPALMGMVNASIYESLVRADSVDPLNKDMNDEEYRQLYENPDYEMICRTHWKRFLAEVDLYKRTVEVVEPTVIVSIGGDIISAPITLALHPSHFIDEDMARPFTFNDPQYARFQHCQRRLL